MIAYPTAVMTRTALKAVLVLVCTMFGSGVDGDMAGEQPLEITPPSYRKTKNLNSLNMGLRGEHKAPFPTNAWWGNLVLEEGQEVSCTPTIFLNGKAVKICKDFHTVIL